MRRAGDVCFSQVFRDGSGEIPFDEAGFKVSIVMLRTKRLFISMCCRNHGDCGLY